MYGLLKVRFEVVGEELHTPTSQFLFLLLLKCVKVMLETGNFIIK